MALAVDGLSTDVADAASGSCRRRARRAARPSAVPRPTYLALPNTSAGPESYSAFAVDDASGDHVVATGTLAAGSVAIVSGSPLSAAGLDPDLVRASGRWP